jgi:hypothetical protein
MPARIRYNVLVRSSSRGVGKADFFFNKDPQRPGSIAEAVDETVAKQYAHLGFGTRMNGTTKYAVRGLRFTGAGVDGTDVVFMWCPQTKAVVVIGAVRA